MTHRHDKESLQLENRRAAKNRVPWEQRRRASMETGSGCRLHHRYLLGFEQIQSLTLSYHKIKGKPLSGVFWSLMEIGVLWWSSTLLSISQSRSPERMTPGMPLVPRTCKWSGGRGDKVKHFLSAWNIISYMEKISKNLYNDIIAATTRWTSVSAYCVGFRKTRALCASLQSEYAAVSYRGWYFRSDVFGSLRPWEVALPSEDLAP